MDDALKATGERQVGTTYDNIANDHFKRYSFIADKLLSAGVTRVFDIGCGVGYGAHLLASSGLNVIAYDNSDASIAFARKYWWHPNIRYYVQDVSVLQKLPQNSAIVLFEIIEHMESPELLLMACANNGNMLYVSSPNETANPFSKDKFPFHYRHYTQSELSELLVSSGWNVTDWYHQKDKATGDIYLNGSDSARTLIARAVA